RSDLGYRYHEASSHSLARLWDIGLEVGQSVRTVSECQDEARADVTVTTNLMESRTLVGDEALRQAMLDAVGPQHMWTSAEFFRAKRADGIHHGLDRKSTRLNSSHVKISYAVFCLKKKKKHK